MSEVILHGFPGSTYVWTARATLVAKGVPHRIQPPKGMREAAYRAIHPFHKMPALTHGDVHLFETLAIVHYVDRAFDGPALLPTDPADIGRVYQWVSVATAYAYPAMVPSFMLEYIFPKGADGGPRREVIEDSLPGMRRVLALLDEALAGRGFLVGEALSLADLYTAPLLLSLGGFPEGPGLLAEVPAVMAYATRMGAEPAFAGTSPVKR